MVIEDAAHLVASRTERALVKLVTENGFDIVRLGEVGDSSPGVRSEYCFIVRAPDGDERDIVVEFTQSAIALIQYKRSAPLSTNSSFWMDSAERSLATYIWERTKFPSGGRLIVDEVCLNELAVADRWDKDSIPDRKENRSRPLKKVTVLRPRFSLRSLVLALSLCFIAALARGFRVMDVAHVPGMISVLILSTAIFVSGILVGLTIIHFAAGGRVPKVTVATATKGPDRIAPISYDAEGRTPVERMIHSNQAPQPTITSSRNQGFAPVGAMNE
jgi:hypothetical protein